MKYCGKCGGKIVEGSLFCTHCGARTANYNNAQNRSNDKGYSSAESTQKKQAEENNEKYEPEIIEVGYTAWFGKLPYRNIYHTITLDKDKVNIIKYRAFGNKRQSMDVFYLDIRNIIVSRKYGIYDMIGAVVFTCFFFIFLSSQNYISAILMLFCATVELTTGICARVTLSYGDNGLVEIPINTKSEAEKLANKLYRRINYDGHKINRQM